MLLGNGVRPKALAALSAGRASQQNKNHRNQDSASSFRGQTKLEDLGLVTENKLARLALSRVVIVGPRQGAVTSGV